MYRFPKVSAVAELGRVAPKAAYTPQSGLAGENVYRAFEDSHGDIWISTAADPVNGLTRIERRTGRPRQYGEADGVPPQRLITAFLEDRTGTMWLGSQDKLYRYRGGRFEVFGQSDGFPTGWVTELYADRAGRLWATSWSGLIQINTPQAEKPSFTVYSRNEGLSTAGATTVNEDAWGRLYVGTTHGIDRFSAPPDAARGRLPVKHYTAADGLPLGGVGPGCRDRRGTLWFGSREGLVRLDPEPDRPAEPPPIRITGLRIRGEPRPLSPFGESELKGLALGTNQDQVQIDFAGLDLAPSATLTYEYRLEPKDSGWTATTLRTVNFASVAPGAYRFQVRAVNEAGAVSPAAASVAFEIEAPLSARWWFRMLAATLAGAGLYLIARGRMKRRLEVERLRTRIATDLHDDIGSTLAQIAILSEVESGRAGRENGSEQLSAIAGLARDLAGSMRDIVWAIDPEQDRVGDMVYRMRRFASDLLGDHGIRYEFGTPQAGDDLRLGADVRRQTFLVFKEGLHNMVRHAGCTEARIDLRIEAGLLSLELRDNGKGFEATRVYEGRGLRSMRERCARLGGELTVESGAGGGTTIRLLVPLTKSLHERVGELPVLRAILRRHGDSARHAGGDH